MSLSGTAGYEKRFGDVFALSLEGGVTYARAATLQVLMPSVQIGMTWYF